MAKLKTHFDVSKDIFFSYVEKWMKGEENKVYLTDLKFWTQKRSAFFQRKAVEESQISSNVSGYIVYDAIQMQVSENLSLNEDHMMSLSFHMQKDCGLYGNKFFGIICLYVSVSSTQVYQAY